MNITDEEILRALQHKLGLPVQKPEEAARHWDRLRRENHRDLERIAKQFGEMVEQEMLRMFGIQTRHGSAYHEEKIVKGIFRFLGGMFPRTEVEFRKLQDEFRNSVLWKLRDSFFASRTGGTAANRLAVLRPMVAEGGARFPSPPPRAAPPVPGAKPAPAPTTGAVGSGAAPPLVAEGGATFPSPPPKPVPSVPGAKPTPPTGAERAGVATLPKSAPVSDDRTLAMPAGGLLDANLVAYSGAPTDIEPPAPVSGELEVSVIDSTLPSKSENPAAPTDELPPGAGLWRFVDAPAGPDRHKDFDCQAFDAPPGFQLIGARVRGRKHKHEGTNCDDWFEAASAGGWDVVAVADGAGSCALSRVGAEVSTKAAVKFLKERLSDEDIHLPRELPTGDSNSESRISQVPAIQQLQGLLHEAVDIAGGAVRQAAEVRNEDAKRLSSTLRLVIHRLLDDNRSLLMACSVGDGMTAAVDTAGGLHLLGLEEGGGKYSGETEFITDPRSITPERLAAATFTHVLPLQAMMVMSDGVADPYFPNNPGILRLCTDLLLNQILDTGIETESALTALRAHGQGEPNLGKYSYHTDTPTGPNERMHARIRQSDRFAEALGMKLGDLVKPPPLLLAAGALGEPMNDLAAQAPHEERLRVWLDTFYVRGEFDDRTLVVLHRRDRS